LREVGLLLAGVALEVSPRLKLHRGGDRVEAGRAAAPEFGLAKGGVAERGRGANESVRVLGVLVIRDLRVADGRAVRAVVLREVGLLLARDALVVDPRLELHRRRDRVDSGGAAAVLLGLTQRGVPVRDSRADRGHAAVRIFIVGKSRIADRAVYLVVLGEVGLFFARQAFEVGPGLEFHRGRDRIGLRDAALKELRFAQGGIHVRHGRADERSGRVVRILLVVGDRRGAHVAARLVALRVVDLLFARFALEVGPRLELHRNRDRVGAGSAAAPELRLAECGIGIRRGGANERGGRVVRIHLVIRNGRVPHPTAVGLVILDEIGLFFAGLALKVRPRLEHGREHAVGTRGAAAVELRLAERGVGVRECRADDGSRAVRILVVGNLRIAYVDAVRAVVLREVRLFLAGLAFEVGPSLERHRSRERRGAGDATLEEFSLAER